MLVNGYPSSPFTGKMTGDLDDLLGGELAPSLVVLDSIARLVVGYGCRGRWRSSVDVDEVACAVVGMDGMV